MANSFPAATLATLTRLPTMETILRLLQRITGMRIALVAHITSTN